MPKAAKKSTSKSRARSKKPSTGRKRPTAAQGRNRQPKGESLEQLRALLFGAELKATRERTDRLEKVLATELAAIRAESHKRVLALTARVDKDLESMLRRLKSLSTRVTGVSQSVDEKLADTRKKAAKADAGVRTSLIARCDELRDELEARYQELTEALSAELDEFRNSRPDRSDLSHMFGEFARQLSGRTAKRKK